jgi:hypothetical protein
MKEYHIRYYRPRYYLITKKKLLGLIPYWATIYSSGILENVEAEFKKLTVNEQTETNET